MSNAFIQLRHHCATLEVGTTDRSFLCPWCGGGGDKEKAFAVTRTSEAAAKYICHRASCGRHGRIAVWGFRLEQALDPSAKTGKSFTPRLYTGNTGKLGEEWYTELLERYQIEGGEADRNGWLVDLGSGRLVCPILSPLGVVRGVELRRPKDQVPFESYPKTKSYRFCDEPWLAWYRKPESPTTVLVEDHISALKVFRHFQVVCLHGSHISLEMALEIIGVVGNKDVVVALDADATAKALAFIAKNRFLAPNFRAVTLSKDLKYSTDEEIERICKK